MRLSIFKNSFKLNKTDKYLIIISAAIAILTMFCMNVFLSPPDTAAYYSVAHSFVVDYDQFFTNEYTHFEFLFSMFWITPTGYISNDWPIGTGLIMAPFMFAAHLCQQFLRLFSPDFAADGFSAVYQVFSSLGLILLSIAGLWAGFIFSSRRFSYLAALGGCGLVLLGSPLFFYLYYANYMSHIPGFVFVSFFILLWSETKESRTFRDWALLGLLAGITAIIRPQNILILSVFIPEIIVKTKNLKNNKEDYILYLKGYVLMFLFILIGFLPQFVFWWKIYGRALQLPKIEEMDWFSPNFISMFFSDYHGIFLWTPLVVFSFSGLLLLIKKDKITASGLLVLLIIQIYINAANEIWWASGSLGNRRFVDIGIIFIAGTSALISGKKWKYFLPLLILCALWTMTLVSAERAQVITLEHYEPWNKEYFSKVLNHISNPLKAVASLKGAFAGITPISRVVLSFLMFVFSLIFIFVKNIYFSDPGSFKKSYKHPVFYPVYIWVIISLAFIPCVFRTQKPDLDKTFSENKINYEPSSLWHNYYEMGYFYLCKNRLEDSINAFGKAIEINPKHPMPYRYLGSIYAMTNRPVESAKSFEKAIELFPDYIQAKLELRRVYKWMLSYYPDDLPTKKKLEKLEKELSENKTQQ